MSNAIEDTGEQASELGACYLIRIISSENERSWAAEMIGVVMSAIFTEHHHRWEGMIFLSEHGWHPANECEVLKRIDPLAS